MNKKYFDLCATINESIASSIKTGITRLKNQNMLGKKAIASAGLSVAGGIGGAAAYRSSNNTEVTRLKSLLKFAKTPEEKLAIEKRLDALQTNLKKRTISAGLGGAAVGLATGGRV